MKILKSKLFFFLLGIIISGSIAYAASTINANEITYIDKDENETTVDKVLDDLYTDMEKYDKSEMELAIEPGYFFYFFPINNSTSYKYFKVHASHGQGGSCSIELYNITTKVSDLSFDTDYLTANTEGYAQRRIRLQSSGSYCNFVLTYHN